MRLDIYNEVIRHMTEDIKINCAEIARRMDCDPRTVKRYTSELPVKKRRSKKSILDDYKNIIMTKVDDYGASAQAIYDFIKVKGYTGSYTTVRRFVMEYKKSCHKRNIRKAVTKKLRKHLKPNYVIKLKMTGRKILSFIINILNL